ncbi:hypothetical protein DPV78_000523 [Talaromyces pinophilus]|nr:hypothetical protein DPV78_000523 [Talaromyces pinophilus]
MEQNKDKGGYRFGIELEYRLTLRHNRDDYSDRQKIKKRLAELWNEAGNGVQGHISMTYGCPMDKAKDFKVWSIVDEDSMEGSADPLTFGYEFVSPIFKYEEGMKWANQIKRLSNYIMQHTEPGMNETTGLHVHVSPANGRWSLADLKRVAEAIVYFDEPLRTLFPEHKYTKACLKSNLRDNPSFSTLLPGQSANSLVQNAQTIDELIDIMNPMKEEDVRSRRTYAWNFTNNSENPSICATLSKNTIEFRSPRSTTECKLIEQWIAFTVTFLHGSAAPYENENIYNDFEPTLDGLNGFLCHNRPPGGTDDYCWEKHLSTDMRARVVDGLGHHTVDF